MAVEPLRNLTICVTGLVKPNKDYWKNEIRALGGAVKEMKPSKGAWSKVHPDIVVTSSETVRTNTACIIHCRRQNIPLVGTNWLRQVKAVGSRVPIQTYALEHELYPDGDNVNMDTALASIDRENLHAWGNLGTSYVNSYVPGVDFDDRTEDGRVRKMRRPDSRAGGLEAARCAETHGSVQLPQPKRRKALSQSTDSLAFLRKHLPAQEVRPSLISITSTEIGAQAESVVLDESGVLTEVCLEDSLEVQGHCQEHPRRITLSLSPLSTLSPCHSPRAIDMINTPRTLRSAWCECEM
jgi:hypothetical protein